MKPISASRLSLPSLDTSRARDIRHLYERARSFAGSSMGSCKRIAFRMRGRCIRRCGGSSGRVGSAHPRSGDGRHAACHRGPHGPSFPARGPAGAWLDAGTPDRAVTLRPRCLRMVTKAAAPKRARPIVGKIRDLRWHSSS
jgi:hypothetical protein